MTVRAIVITPEGDVILRSIEPDLEHIKAAIGGGWIEAIRGDGWHGYVDEEGKLKGMPMNTVGSAIAARFGWQPYDDILCGPLVMFGNDPEGEEADVPDAIVATLLDMGVPIRED